MFVKRKFPPKWEFSFHVCPKAVENYARFFAALRFVVFFAAFFTVFFAFFFAAMVVGIKSLICRPVSA